MPSYESAAAVSFALAAPTNSVPTNSVPTTLRTLDRTRTSNRPNVTRGAVPHETPLHRHRAFVFGLAFLLAAAFAMAVQAGTFAFGDSRGDTWVAPAVLLATGAVAVIGTLIAAATNRSGSTEPGPAVAVTTAVPIVVPDRPIIDRRTIVAPDGPTFVSNTTGEMPTTVESTVGDDDLTAEQPLTGSDRIDRRDDADETGTPPLS